MSRQLTPEQYVASVLATAKQRDPDQILFHQALEEILTSFVPLIKKYPELFKNNLLERFVEAERIIQFRVSWIDDKGDVQVNRGWRVQYSSALGPYKGGLRFHPSVNLSTIKFLALEQTIKNSLTGLPMGAGKGGSDFDPKGKSDREVQAFCQSFMLELFRHIGPNVDVPAGDIGVGGREIGFLYGMYKKIQNEAAAGVLTGKDLSYGGSLLRPEATGYGCVYFAREMLKTRGKTFAGLTVVVSGSGNVAQFACEKATQLGAKVVALSDSNGVIYDPSGIDAAKLAYVKHLKEVKRGRISEYASQYPGSTYTPVLSGKQQTASTNPIWAIKCDVALPCATQNELGEDDAKKLVENGCFAVAEGANMPTTPHAVEILQKAGVFFAPGKASNAAGVACSGLEMSQNSLRLQWTAEEVEKRLDGIMVNIHKSALAMSKELLGKDAPVDYVLGANCAGFFKIARSMNLLGSNL